MNSGSTPGQVESASNGGRAGKPMSEAGTVPSEAITSTTSAATPAENEDVDKAAESIVADVHVESVEAAEQGSLQSAEVDDGAADKLAEDSPSHAAGSEEESSVVDHIPAIAELQELSSEVAEEHMAAAGGEESVGSEEATVEESGVPVGDAQSVEGSDEVDRQIPQGDQISEVVPGGHVDANLGTPMPDNKVESSPEDSTVVSDTTEEVSKAAEVGTAEKSWQLEASAAELVGSATDEVQRKDPPPGPLEGTEGSMEDEGVNLRPLEHVESIASNSCRSETNVPPAVEESGSDVESSPLLSNTSGISSMEVSEAMHALENETNAAEPAIVGNPSSGQEGLKVGSKKKKEFLAQADAAGNTADLYNAYKVPEEKKSVEVKRSEVSGAGSSGSDVKDSAMAQDKSLPKAVNDFHVGSSMLTEEDLVDKGDGSGGLERSDELFYEPPRILDSPFMSYDLVSSLQAYSPVGVRHMIMPAGNCITPLLLTSSHRSKARVRSRSCGARRGASAGRLRYCGKGHGS